MSYKDMARRLEALETHQDATDTTQDGYAPVAWTHIAAWAIMQLDADDERPPLPDEPDPYDIMGHRWLITHFWQRGTDRYLSATNADRSLSVILACVDSLVRQGMPRREIRDWRTGRRVWDEVWSVRHHEPWNGV